ncbi:MAG: hypothetical protein KGN33_17295 [Paracoccaceae bacterium]|nr:hypothetical protein [Paracoccaceae bacterium]
MTDDDALALVLTDAKERPMTFIEVLGRRLLAHPDGRKLLAAALRDLAEAYNAEARALQADGDGAEVVTLKPLQR